MKHIKTFENLKLGDNIKLKKYVIWEMSLVLVILEVTDIVFNKAKFKRLYIYRPDAFGKDNKLRSPDSNNLYEFDYKDIEKHVIYQSDNLEELLDFDLLAELKSHYDAKMTGQKYNL